VTDRVREVILRNAQKGESTGVELIGLIKVKVSDRSPICYVIASYIYCFQTTQYKNY